MGWYASERIYTLDRHRGFGLLFDRNQDRTSFRKAFYEDGTLQPGEGAVSYSDSIEELRRFEEARFSTTAIQKQHDQWLQEAECRFTPGKDGKLYALLSRKNEKIRIEAGRMDRWYTEVKCDCGKGRCVHIHVAADFLAQRLQALQHAYVVSDQEVDKSLFLEEKLCDAILNLDVRVQNQDLIEEIRNILEMIRSAHSREYYWNVHRYLLSLSPSYDYDARLLEERFDDLLIALFEDPGYREAVLDTGSFADPENYEERQHRSNRASLKRVLKEYQKAAKALDEKGDYGTHPYKEFLLKYRGDRAGLMRYYAEGKEKPGPEDWPFLREIAGLEKLNPDDVAAVAKKLDEEPENGKETEAVLSALTASLSADRRVEIYSQLRRLSLPPAEIRALPREDQRKMIRNTPLSAESFGYIMDDLLADGDAAERGKMVLFATQKARFSRNDGLKRAVAEQAFRLPDNRLLLAFVRDQLNIRDARPAQAGDPERELKTCFECDYDIIRTESRLYALFLIRDPESKAILLEVMEENGNLRPRDSLFGSLGYAPELIRKVCLEGKEEKYDEAFEESRDALAAAQFEKNNHQFAREYQELCNTLADEKILYTETGKVGIDWQIGREGGVNSLSFRVGRNRMYVVKDAAEFVSAFRQGTTVEYGRDLILTHDPDNLNETDAALMKMLMTARFGRGRKGEEKNKRYIKISDALLGNILETLNGRTVFYNETPCLLRLEPKKVRLKISGRYILSTDLRKDRQELLNLVGKGYLLTRSDGKESATMDRVEGAAEEINLMSLIDRNPSVSIQPILKDFRKKIYSRFFELFDVDPSVQRDFTLSRIRLNTYFDLEKGTITARTALLRGEKEIRPEEITDRMDRVKVELLDHYLQSLGFSDGVLAEESRVLAFFKMDFTRLKTLTNVYLSDQLKNKELKSVGRPVIRVTYQNNLVRVFLEKSDFSEEELEQIIAGLRKKRKYILLGGDRIVDLDSEAARDFGEAVQDFDMDPADLYKKKTVSMIQAIKAFAHEKSCRVDKYLRDMIEEIRSFKESDIPLPALNAELRDYQVEGFRWMSILARYGMGGVLADDMGLGKTLQVIALIKSDRSRKPSLVVCPKSLVFNWISEFARFDGATRVTAIYGPDGRRSELISAIRGKEKAVYVTSYDSLRNDIARYETEFNYVILDEAQYIKNVHALKTRSVKELKAAHRFALTGTPIENSVVDLWSIFDFIMPGYFEELSRFRDTEPALIARKAGPFILRRVKEDVLEDLPAKYERILSAEMSEGQRKLYDAMRQEARRALEEGGKAFDLLPYLTRLRQVCVDPGMFVEQYRGGSGKMDLLSTLIPEYLEANHRILIFSQFVKALEIVRDMLEKKGIASYFLSGATAAKDRVEMMDAFNNGSGTDVFLISLKAGGTGLNLTGADTVIHLDPWWNVAAENQASDRTHRIGQTRNVEVIKLIAGDTIEQRVVELQDLKKEVIRQVISDNDGSVTSASLEDIAYVLE